jgi:hypothetical protein
MTDFRYLQLWTMSAVIALDTCAGQLYDTYLSVHNAMVRIRPHFESIKLVGTSSSDRRAHLEEHLQTLSFC